MSKDEAFKKWLTTRALGVQGPDYPRDHIERVACDAWHAAVEHTLSLAAAKRDKDREKREMDAFRVATAH